MKILIAEDDLINQKILLAFLEGSATTTVANNGIEALARFEEAHTAGMKFDLILLDIMMPGLDGQDTLKCLRKAESGYGIEGLDRVPVIITTCLDDSKNVLEAFRSGADGYLTKPIERSNLSSLLTRLGLPTLKSETTVSAQPLSEELQIFILEANENFDRIEGILLELDRVANAANSVNQLFRSIHTIKGNCGFLGLTSLESFCHRAESILDALRSGRGQMNPEISSLLLEVVDAGRETLATIQRQGIDSGVSYPELNNKLEQTIVELRAL